VGSFASILGVGAITVLGNLYGRIVVKRLFQRRLWKIKIRDLDNLYIYISSKKDVTQPRIIERIITTGIGEVKALNHILNSISQGYQTNIKSENILMSGASLPVMESKHLILLGGPLTNQYTREILDRLPNLRITTDDSVYSVSYENDDWTIKTEDDSIDYGIIIYIDNIFDSTRSYHTRLNVLFGLHTYGTLAASKYFVNDFYKKFVRYRYIKNILTCASNSIFFIFNNIVLPFMNYVPKLFGYERSNRQAIRYKELIRENIIAIVKCQIITESATAIRPVKHWTFPSSKLF
jgi:hypothetical protein